MPRGRHLGATLEVLWKHVGNISMVVRDACSCSKASSICALPVHMSRKVFFGALAALAALENQAEI